MTLETLSRPPVVDLKQFPQGETSTIKDEYIQRVMLPNGKEVVFKKRSHGRVGMPELLTSLIANDKTPTTVSQMYKNNTIQSERSFTELGSKLRKRISQYGYVIRGVRSEDGEFGLVMEDEKTNKIALPDGTTIFIDRGLHREVFQRLLKGDGVDAEAVYGKTTKKNEDKLNAIVTKLRKKLPSDKYAINSRRDNKGVLRFLFETKLVTLPNGTEIRDLIPQDFLILQHFVNTDLPIHLSSINAHIQPGLDTKTANHRMQTYISRINKALGENGNIKKATKKHGSLDPSYRLVVQTEDVEYPFSEAEDKYISQQIEKITHIIDAQENDRNLTLTDEANDYLKTKLEKLKNEQELRERIQKRLEEGREWYRSHPEPKRAEVLTYVEPEPECEPLVKFTRIRYLFSNKGLPNEILDEVGQEAFKKAKESFSPENGFSFEEYADFWIRGAMGNMLLYNSPEAPETEHHGLSLPDESITSFKKDFAIALIDLSSRRRYPENFITPYESRALDIMRGITGKNPGSSEDVAYEFDSSIQWAERLARTGMEKLMNSPHAEKLREYLAA